MHVGVCIIRMRIPENGSLKDKRRVLKSIISRITAKFNVSAAEIENNDSWQMAVVGISCVSNDKRHANEILSKAVDFVSDTRFEVEILDYSLEIIPVFDI